ncbi:hypothetical protein ACHAW5_009765 [Stephanodiscus triporus]|uniref:Uncharacterized protein n=1 Tax=Stephanodiscus triporus TaxID=2934178 RepID=A0ABD3QSB3_9STRA
MVDFQDDRITRTREFNSALAFLGLSRSRAGRNIFLVEGRPKPYASSTFTIVSNDYHGVVNVVPYLFDDQIILDNSYGIATSVTRDVLSTQDIVNGAILACVLAVGYSFLNGQSSSSSFVSWPSESKNRNGTIDIEKLAQGNDTDGNDRIFNADDWKEMSREENYILYKTKIRQRSNADNPPIRNIDKKENKLVLVALLALFVPIFSVEFFFALSRQFMCEIGMGGEIVQKLCAPS